ncbi:LacI family DNA-binding transcriptional regulator [Cohnella sp. LGH]|uniref:LacI family DNA-binding transcriptional regulator n=1 Tax=Cohnella sp. LGH TaxID=1619153 RepID=UPI001ADD361D|nr:LacI family DNA-binding transcriptional regulator [Cohnella sp. LGH]QTH43139.1 LacI family DNA-binding transcriptional regulator [Cohnella sp. LGH]
MADIHEVAREAGVSVATVSRVLNNHSSVSAKTRKKVEEVIERLNYEPNMLGKSLRASRSHRLLVLIPDISNPFYAKVVSGIESVAKANHNNIMLCTTDSSTERELFYYDMVKKKLADGMITIDPSFEFYELLTTTNRYPVVICGEHVGNANAPCVSIDNTKAAYKAVKHLLTIGHRKIALVNSNIYTAGLRQQGYLRALEEHGIEVDSRWVVHADLGFERAQLDVRELLTMQERPTAIFAVSDTIALSILKVAKDLGLRVPEELAVVGFDNIDFAAVMNPTLTTVSQPMFDMGRHSGAMLLRRIADSEAVVNNISLDHDLIIRESTMKY